MEILDKITEAVKRLTEIGLSLIALGVVLQIIFGGTGVPFLGLDILGSLLAVVKQLGAQGLVGLVALLVLYVIYTKK
jgi:hypothetical protein